MNRTLAAPADVYPDAPGEPELLYLLSRIQEATRRLGVLHEVGKSTANRVFGGAPEAPMAGLASPQSDGMISMLHAVVDDLHRRITDCEGEMQRLSAL